MNKEQQLLDALEAVLKWLKIPNITDAQFGKFIRSVACRKAAEALKNAKK